MIEFFVELSKYYALICVGALILILYVRKERTAFELVLLILLITTGFHMWLQSYLTPLSNNAHTDDEIWYVRNLWYLGFSSTYLLAVLISMRACAYKLYERDFCSNLLLFCASANAVILITRYLDRFIIRSSERIANNDFGGTAFFELLNRAGVPTINAIMTISVVIYAISVLLKLDTKSHYQTIKAIRSWKW